MLVPGLEERARFLPPLDRCHQLTPGYLDAPATALAPLGHISHIGKRGYPEVTLVFCTIDKYSDMRAVNRELARDVLESYNDTVRRSLLAVGGYECQVRARAGWVYPYGQCNKGGRVLVPGVGPPSSLNRQRRSLVRITFQPPAPLCVNYQSTFCTVIRGQRCPFNESQLLHRTALAPLPLPALCLLARA